MRRCWRQWVSPGAVLGGSGGARWQRHIELVRQGCGGALAASDALTRELGAELGAQCDDMAALVEFGAVYADGKRLLRADAPVRCPGAKLRVHLAPRRFPAAHAVDWRAAVVRAEPDFLLVRKPAGVPCHATLDNAQENVLACLQRAHAAAGGGGGGSEPGEEEGPRGRGSSSSSSSSSTVLRAAHRLDVDTSGLLVVARTREFAAHFAKQLRRPGRVRKHYRVLVEDSRAVGGRGGGGGALPGSRGGQVQQQHLSAGTTLVHWTDKAQKRAPRCFLAKLPPPPRSRHGAAGGAAGAEAAGAEAEARRWQKCSLVVHSVLQHRVVVPTGGSSDEREPEPPLLRLEVEPLEGRTHQIRGQLAAAGYPVQGDAYYGHGSSREEHQLALVASSIQFEDRAGVTVRETLPHPW